MATWAAPQPPTHPALKALRTLLRNRPVAVYLPATGRIYRCPNLLGHQVPCDRAATFTVPEAQLLAQRIRAGELGPIPPGQGPIVLVYGVPWAWSPPIPHTTDTIHESLAGA
jgi:hypothetical protein